MKFRVSIAGGNNNTSNNPFGGLRNVSVPSVAMNFVSNGENKNPISNAMGGLTQQGGVILSSDEILEVSYSTNPIYGETMSASQSQVTLRIVGRLLPTASENNSPEDEGEGIVSGIMGTLGMGTLFNQYKSVKHLFDKNNEAGEELPEASLSSNLLSSSGITEPVAKKTKESSKSKLVSQVLGVSSALPMTNSFTNGIGNSLKGMFGGLGNFGESNLYDQNKQNVKELSLWAMTYGDEKSTRDVMVQTDLGGGKTFELYFPKMYVDSFNQDFSVGNGEGDFEMILKQTIFNEESINLK